MGDVLTRDSLGLLLLHSVDIHGQAVNHNAHLLEVVRGLVKLVGRVKKSL